MPSDTDQRERPKPDKARRESADRATERVLIVGIGAGFGRVLARRLARDYSVVGVDRHRISAKLPDIPLYRVDPRKRGLEDVFRTERPKRVIHLGVARGFESDDALRHDLNVRGSQRILDHCVSYKVKQLIVLSTSYVYGALPDNPQFMTEEHPLGAARQFPEMRDFVSVDALSTSFMHQHPKLQVSVLRPVPVLGSTVSNLASRMMLAPRTLLPLGFSPMQQFLHEDDLTEALRLTLEQRLRGVYNIEGPGELPLRVAVREAGGRAVSIPDFLLRRLSEPLLGVPAGAVDFMRYPCTIDGSRFAKETGFEPAFDLKEIFRDARRARRN